MTKPKLCIVLVNYKGYKDTIECIESILKSDYQNFQIIVIDNSPDYESVDQFKRWAISDVEVVTDYPNIIFPLASKPIEYIFLTQNQFEETTDVYREKLIIVKASENRGFAAANNIGARYVMKFDVFNYLWLLNNDTVLFTDSISNMLEPIIFPAYKYVGIIGVKQLYYSNSNRIQACGAVYNKFWSLSKHIGEYEIDKGQYDHCIDTSDYVVGASMLVSVDFLLDVGYMCEDYFLYYEEIDWAQRAKLKGYSIKIHQNAKILHKQGGTIGKFKTRSSLAEFSSIKSRILITRKFFPNYIFTVYLSMVGVLINRIRRMEFSHIPNVLKAIYSGVTYRIN